MTSNIARQRILGTLTEHPLKIKTVPRISGLLSGLSTHQELEDISIEDLLDREPVEPDPTIITKTIFDKTILVTGAGGSIGSELCKQIVYWKPRRLVLIDISEFAIYSIFQTLSDLKPNKSMEIIPLVGSVQDEKFLSRVFSKYKIQFIYHAAAYKHVPLMEQNTIQCILNNVFGTLNVGKAAIKAGVEGCILVSTDKAVNPTNFMGASKKIGRDYLPNSDN